MMDEFLAWMKIYLLGHMKENDAVLKARVARRLKSCISIVELYRDHGLDWTQSVEYALGRLARTTLPFSSILGTRSLWQRPWNVKLLFVRRRFHAESFRYGQSLIQRILGSTHNRLKNIYELFPSGRPRYEPALVR